MNIDNAHRDEDAWYKVGDSIDSDFGEISRASNAPIGWGCRCSLNHFWAYVVPVRLIVLSLRDWPSSGDMISRPTYPLRSMAGDLLGLQGYLLSFLAFRT